MEIIIVLTIIFLAIWIFNLSNNLSETSSRLKSTDNSLNEVSIERDKLKELFTKQYYFIEKQQLAIEQKDKLFDQLQHDETFPLSKLPLMMSDFLTLQYDISADFLEKKNDLRPKRLCGLES